MKKAGLAILLAGAVLMGCAKEEVPPPETSTESAQPETAQQEPVQMAQQGIPSVTGDTVTTGSGLKYIDVVVGQGAAPTAGQMISAHYTGWLTDGTKFDSSRDRGVPLQFPIGLGRVIPGWDEGLLSMKVGGRRMLVIPPQLAYGDRGTPGGPIPPGATLVFDVELVEVIAAPAQ